MHELLTALDHINKTIATLLIEQQELKKQILIAANRGHYTPEGDLVIYKEGKQTTQYGIYNIEIGTEYIFNINKERYADLYEQLPVDYNPVRIVEKYDIIKAKYREMERNADKNIQLLFSEIISKKPAAPSFKLTIASK